MIDIKVSINSNSRIAFIKISKIRTDINRGIRYGFYWLGKKLVKDASSMMLEKPRSGRTYLYNGRRHVASVAGEAPANRSGALRRSLDFTVSGFDGMTFGYRKEYGKYLEPKQKLNRPGLLLSIKKNKQTARKYMEQCINKALRK